MKSVSLKRTANLPNFMFYIMQKRGERVKQGYMRILKNTYVA